MRQRPAALTGTARLSGTEGNVLDGDHVVELEKTCENVAQSLLKIEKCIGTIAFEAGAVHGG